MGFYISIDVPSVHEKDQLCMWCIQ